LCVENPEVEAYRFAEGSDLAFITLRQDDEMGTVLALFVYTAPDGGAQREDLQRYPGTGIRPVSREELLDAMNRGMPSSVFIDGQKFAGSVFKAQIKTELDIPLRDPRIIRPDE
jgi:hypothetical protein